MLQHLEPWPGDSALFIMRLTSSRGTQCSRDVGNSVRLTKAYLPKMLSCE